MAGSCEHVAGVVPPTDRDSVHNDECTKCFLNPKSEGGISICLSCFNGGCGEHAKEHFNITRHPVTMKLIKTLKPVPKDAPKEAEPKITKLAIGVEGGAPVDSESDKYDVTTAIVCYACDPQGKEIPKTDELEALCITVNMTSSASDQAQVNQWQLDNYIACSHTKGLKQLDSAPDLSNRSLQHCNKCELNDDLWLCMTCGNLGCARKNFDGSGGNNHGVEHNAQTGHPVVLKVGTITAEGKADLFCYACDDGVVDESLKEHMAHFKIDIATQEKTVKTTAERELRRNLEYDWAATYEKGKKQRLLFGPDHTGLQNLGNSCYMASVIQTVFSFPVFRNRYYEEGRAHLLQCRSASPATCYQCQMAKLAHGLLSGEYSKDEEKDENDSKDGASKDTEMEDVDPDKKQKEQKGIPPRMFKALITQNHAEFRGTQQQDASEFFTYLISEVEKAERVNGMDPSKMFKYKVEERWQCTQCGGVSYKSTKASNITLQIPYDQDQVKREEEALAKKLEDKNKGASSAAEVSSTERADTEQTEQAKKKRKVETKVEASETSEDDCKAAPVELEKCFDIWAEKEEVTKQCNACKNNTKFTKTHRFDSFPDTLVIAMQRFVFFDWVPRKLRTRLIVNDDMDLSKYAGTGLIDGETELPGEAGPVPNAGFVEQLMGMGFSKNRCEHACLAVDNVGVEPAMNWIFANMDNPQYELPVQQKAAASGGNDSIASEENIQQLMMMGFDRDRSKYALGETSNDVARATDWLFSHMDEPLPAQTAAPVDEEMEDKRPPKYELAAFVTHTGKSTSHGHYLAHILKNGRWVLFNDQKVALSEEPPKGDAYMYFFRRV